MSRHRDLFAGARLLWTASRRADVNGTDVRGYQRPGRVERRRSLLPNGRNSNHADENGSRSQRTPERGPAKPERSRRNAIGPDDLLPESDASDASRTVALINKGRASERLRDPSSFLSAFRRTRHQSQKQERRVASSDFKTGIKFGFQIRAH